MFFQVDLQEQHAILFWCFTTSPGTYTSRYKITCGSCIKGLEFISSGRKWLIQGGPIWSSHSPNLGLMGVCLWRYLRCSVYAILIQVHTVAELQQHIENSCEAIRRRVGILENVWHTMKHNVKLCVGMVGAHIQHLLLWYIGIISSYMTELV
jgi:hypothetical protein